MLCSDSQTIIYRATQGLERIIKQGFNSSSDTQTGEGHGLSTDRTSTYISMHYQFAYIISKFSTRLLKTHNVPKGLCVHKFLESFMALKVSRSYQVASNVSMRFSEHS